MNKSKNSWLTDSKRKEFEVIKGILCKNICVTDHLLQGFLDHDIITDLQFSKLTKMDSEKRMNQILNSLTTQDLTNFRRFCDVLIMQGHPLLADFLWKEVFREDNSLKINVELNTLWEKMPRLKESVSKEDTVCLEHFVMQKVAETQFNCTLIDRHESSKEELSEKKKHAEESWKYLKQAKEQSSMARKLESEIKKMKIERQNTEETIQSLKNQLKIVQENEINATKKLEHYEKMFDSVQNKLCVVHKNYKIEKSGKPELDLTTFLDNFDSFCEIVKSLEISNKDLRLTNEELRDKLNYHTQFVQDAQTKTTSKEDLKRELSTLRKEMKELQLIIQSYEATGVKPENKIIFEPNLKSDLQPPPNTPIMKAQGDQYQPAMEVVHKSFIVSPGAKYPVLKPIPAASQRSFPTQPPEIPHCHKKATKREAKIVKKEPNGTPVSSKVMDFKQLPL